MRDAVGPVDRAVAFHQVGQSQGVPSRMASVMLDERYASLIMLLP